ncbi:MAG: hypothetical protein EZS28_015025 [Streblomastix strix]|uniref:Uncharacterized protein n=1 Tax=Streblomastix strix TaxID=222440 RepID=A0A5J4W4D2_9EUKA|nr:MAG: hypothetical protein EZS28_015025 [Streblomastix strix]
MQIKTHQTFPNHFLLAYEGFLDSGCNGGGFEGGLGNYLALSFGGTSRSQLFVGAGGKEEAGGRDGASGRPVTEQNRGDLAQYDYWLSWITYCLGQYNC